MNTVQLGGFTYGDLGSTITLTIRTAAGALVDFTGASSIKLACNAVDDSDSFTVDGDVVTTGQIAFASVATFAARPRFGKRTTYTARAFWTAAGDASPTYARADYRFWIEQFSATDGAGAITLTDLSLPANLGRWNSRPIGAMTTFPAIRETNSLAGSYYINGIAHIIDTSHDPVSGATTNLANRVQEYGELAGPNRNHDIEEGMFASLRYPTIVEMWWNMDGIRQSGFASGDCFVGFELGSLNANTSGGSFSATPSGLGCIQVRFHRTTNDLVLYTCNGDGSAAASKRFNWSLGLSGELNVARRIRLEWWPGIMARLTTKDTGEESVRSIEQTDLTKLPPTVWSTTSGFAFINCTGALAAGNQFSASHGWIHTLRTDWGLS